MTAIRDLRARIEALEDQDECDCASSGADHGEWARPIAWAIAIGAVAWAIAWGQAHAPAEIPAEDPQVACIKLKGEWQHLGWGRTTCKFAPGGQ